MPVAEVIGDLRQGGRRCAFYMQHALRLRDDFNDASVGRRDQIAAAQNLAARQHHADFFARYERRFEAALLPQLERQLELAFDFDLVRATHDLQLVFDLDHQNRKYRCAIGSTLAGSQVSSSPSARTS